MAEPSLLYFEIRGGRGIAGAGALLDQIQRLIYKSDEMSFVDHG